jgi:hypothetical protein
MSIQTTPEADQTAGIIPAAPWRVKALSVLPDYRLAVTFMDGTNGIVDFSAVLTATNAEFSKHSRTRPFSIRRASIWAL